MTMTTPLDKMLDNLQDAEEERWANLKPTEGEKKYVEYDVNFGWCVFGDDSGFCYSQHVELADALTAAGVESAAT